MNFYNSSDVSSSKCINCNISDLISSDCFNVHEYNMVLSLFNCDNIHYFIYKNTLIYLVYSVCIEEAHALCHNAHIHAHLWCSKHDQPANACIYSIRKNSLFALLFGIQNIHTYIHTQPCVVYACDKVCGYSQPFRSVDKLGSLK